MDIRNINQYITALCGKEEIHLLGSNSEPLLQKIYGSDPSPDQVNSVISDVASFAINAEEQLFYEFVQNAYDASADSLYFYANEQYLVVLNNGTPFYTDFDIFKDKRNTREGQLYNFLAKGKSLKWGDDNKLGKYGQGSKLLYTLIADVNDTISNEELLIHTLKEEKKGPILISWYNPRQLANLLQKQREWTLAQGDDYENNILFTKILMSYYPVVPDTEYFSADEASRAIDAFDTLVNPRRNMIFLNRGTAIIIPLGKGKYKKIDSADNMSYVRSGLGCFASITKGQVRNEGKSLEHIYVLGEEIEQYPVQSITVEYEEEERKFHYYFAFNHEFATARENFVNLFKGLPIHDSMFHLGFIIDSQTFEVDSSRQRITDRDKTKRQLLRAFEELVQKLRELHEMDIKKFDHIYKAIVASQDIQDNEANFINEAFHETFTPFLKEYVLTSSGTYEKLENVRKFADDYNFPLQEIGVNQYHWIEDSIADDLKRHGIDVKEVNLCDILADSDPTMMQHWIKSLSHKDYIVLHKFLDKYKTDGCVRAHKLFRSNKYNLYSYEELLSTVNVYYSYVLEIPFGECEHIEEPLNLSDGEKNIFHKNLINKIIANIDYFRSSDSSREDAIRLLCWLVERDSNFEKEIKKICLLQNLHDEYVSFSNLLSERPENTILFDNYLVKGYVPMVVEERGWLLSPAREPKLFWDWLVGHWQSIQDNESWDETNTPIYVEDIKRVAEQLETSKYTRLSLYLNDEGEPQREEQVVVCNASRLTEEEYEYLGQKIKTVSLQPYRYYQTLMKPPFYTKTISVNDIIDKGLEVDETLLGIIVKISDSFLTKYRVHKIADHYYRIELTALNTNYIDNVEPNLEEALLKADLFRVPNYVQKLIGDDLSKDSYQLKSNPELIKNAIEGIENTIALLPFVKNFDTRIVADFFNHLKTIDINKKITNENLQWQTIDLAIKRSDNNNLVDIIFPKLRYHGKELPDSIPQQYIKIGEEQYDIFKLDEDYKNANETIISFFNSLPPGKESTFKNTFYHAKEEEIDVGKLYDKLKQNGLSIEQLRFCLHYSIDNNVSECGGLRLKNESETIRALEMILEKNFKGFDKYFVIPKVNYCKHIFAPGELLRNEERLPDEVFYWINNHRSVTHLFSRLRASGPYIGVRRALNEDKSFTDFKPFADERKETDIEAVINWAIEKKFTYDYDSNRYKTMMGIVEHIPESYENLPLLRYVEVSQQEKKLTFIMERMNEDCVFLSPYSREGRQLQQLQNQLQRSKELSELIRQKTVYVYNDEEMLFRHKLNNKLRWKISTFVDISAFPEYNDSTYKEWKTMKDSKGLTIHIAKQPIERTFSIKDSNDKTVFSEKLNNNVFGYNPEKGIVVQHPNNDNLSVMKTIAQYIVDMAFFKEPFIALQALYVEKWEKEQNTPKIDISHSSLNPNQAQKAINKISPETAMNIEHVNKITKQIDAESLKKLESVADQVKELLELSEADLKRIVQNKEELLEILDKAGEEKEASVNQIIGYIGELVYQGYLKKNGKNFEYSAQDGVGEYDFKIEDNIYVDVKTTLYSLKSGTAPFYLHRSQHKFLKENPECNYHIVRLSLIDLDLQEEYETLRKRFGRIARPSENEDLCNECEKLANDFWEKASPGKFEEISQEYVITLVQKTV